MKTQRAKDRIATTVTGTDARTSRALRLLVFGIVSALLVPAVSSVGAQENPFFGDGAQEDSAAEEDPAAEDTAPEDPVSDDAVEADRGVDEPGIEVREQREPGVLATAYARTRRAITRAQRRLNRDLSSLILDTRGERSSLLAWLAIIAFSFSYGLLHAVLPGHRKTVLISYYIAQPARIRHGVIVGFTFALMHVISATAVVTVAVVSIQIAASRAVSDLTGTIQIASSWLIIAIGIGYLAFKIRAWVAAREEREAERMRRKLELNDNSDLTYHISRSGPQSIWPAVLSAGIVPCPVTTSVLLFAISVGAIGVGAVAVLGLSLGLGVALAAISAVTIVFKNRVLAVFERRGVQWLTMTVELLGILAIIGFGVLTLALNTPF